jgi:hypothetical protein
MGEQPSENPDKALAFYLYQDYDENGSTMCVQIYVPKEMQDKYCGAKVYFSSNDVDFPDISSRTLIPAVWYSKINGVSDRECNYICSDNCIYIKNENEQLSGCGIIAFIDGTDINASPNERNCYKFVINYTKKEIISYRVVERKSAVLVEGLYPLLRENVQLGIVKKRGAKPTLVRDFRSDSSRGPQLKKSEIIELKANGRVEDVAKKVMKVDDPSQYDFRLMFLDSRHATHYLLVDESDYTIEDQAQRKKDMMTRNKISIHQHRCPYCGMLIEPLPRKYHKHETAIVGCNGKEITTNTSDARLKGKVTRVCSSDLVELSKFNPTSASCIQKNKLIIPEDYDELPSMNVVVAGFPKSGKTIYLSSIFNMIDGGPGQGIRAYPAVLNEILASFDKKSRGERTVDEVKFLSVDEENNYTINDAVERERISPREDIKLRYVMSAGKNVEAQSPKEIAWKLSWQPIGFRIGDLGYSYFYDIPGEMFTVENTDKVRALDMADCLLAVINGAPEVADPIGELLTTLKNITSLSKHNEDEVKNMPIAIVFTKHDLKLTDYLGREKNNEYCFDENCHVVRENIIGMLPKNGKYEGSMLERHIDCSSYELEHYLKARDSKGGYKMLKDNYKNIKFFTCSALGSDSCLGKPIDGNKEVLFKPRRLRVELPIIWLMYKNGLIKR